MGSLDRNNHVPQEEFNPGNIELEHASDGNGSEQESAGATDSEGSVAGSDVGPDMPGLPDGLHQACTKSKSCARRFRRK